MDLQRVLAAPSLQAAADLLGVSKPRASFLLARAGFAHHFRKRREARHAEWVRRMRRGDSDAAIARDHGVSAAAVRLVRRKHRIASLARGRRAQISFED